jgi:hypothetical protein
MDLFPQYKKLSNESTNSTSKSHTHSSSNKDLSSSQRVTSSPTSSSNNSKQQQQQQFATKLPPEKSPAASFLKEALLIGSSAPKLSTSPLAVDNMLNKSHNSPKTNTKPPSTTLQNPLPNTQRSSVSNKSNTNRPSTDLTPHRTDQQVRSFVFQQTKFFLSKFFFRINNKNLLHLQIDHNRIHHHLPLFPQHLDVQQQDLLLPMINR